MNLLAFDGTGFSAYSTKFEVKPLDDAVQRHFTST